MKTENKIIVDLVLAIIQIKCVLIVIILSTTNILIDSVILDLYKYKIM
jgi:hypothetical protein